jgi:lysophospholipase L1-like esterase
METTSTAPSKTIHVKSSNSDILVKIILSLVTPLLFIGLIEFGAYLWEKRQANGLYAWELVASRRMEWIIFDSPGAGYTLMKPGSYYEWQGIPVVINSHGLRDRETSYEKPENTFRILNLGDSIAMGWGVRLEDTYGKKLEELLNQDETVSIRYEVINAGVPGWNLENSLAYLQAEGLKYEPDLILLDLTIVNDINGTSAVKPVRPPAHIEWMRANTYTWPFISIQMQWATSFMRGRERIEIIDPPTYPAKYFPLDPESPRYPHNWNLISAMNKLAEEHSAKFLVLMFPVEFQVLDADYPTLPQEFFLTMSAEAGVNITDLLPVYQEACKVKLGGKCELQDRYLFADVWMHPSALGHMISAQEIVHKLDEILKNLD